MVGMLGPPKCLKDGAETMLCANIKQADHLGLTENEAAFVAKILTKLLTGHFNIADPRSLELHDLSGRLYASRRERRHFFDQDLFADPAWDILLILHHAMSTDQQFSVSSICACAEVPYTTALRWITGMERLGLLEREKHPDDGRSILIRLTAPAQEQMNGYLAKVRDRYFSPR
jgi:DNA-binding MarR family transcriptional regulator